VEKTSFHLKKATYTEGSLFSVKVNEFFKSQQISLRQRSVYFSKTHKSYPQLAVFTPIFSKFAALRKKSR
jgi:hypothetical protein